MGKSKLVIGNSERKRKAGATYLIMDQSSPPAIESPLFLSLTADLSCYFFHAFYLPCLSTTDNAIGKSGMPPQSQDTQNGEKMLTSSVSNNSNNSS